MNPKASLLKQTYQPGYEIRLISMKGEPKMSPGLSGIVKCVDDDGQIHVRWQNGSSLALNYDEDEFVTSRCFSAKTYLEQKLHLIQDSDILYAEGHGAPCEHIDTAQLIERAQGYADRNIEITHELAQIMCKPYDMAVTYDCFLADHIRNVHELLRDDPYLKIPNLARFKKFVRLGGKLKVIRSTMRPEREGMVIQAKEIHVNHVYYAIVNEPEHPISQANGGKGMRLAFTKTGDYVFGDTILWHLRNKNDDLIEWIALPHWYPEGGNEET